MNAKKTGFVIYGKYSNLVEYEYRGEKYEVEYSNCWNYYCISPKIQHKDAQAKIDKKLDNVKEREYNEEDSAQYGFDLFWNYVEGKSE